MKKILESKRWYLLVILTFVFLVVPGAFYWTFIVKKDTGFIEGKIYQKSFSEQSNVDINKIENGIAKGSVKKVEVKKVAAKPTKKIVKKVTKKVVVPKVKKAPKKDKEDPAEKTVKATTQASDDDITIEEAIKKYKTNNSNVALGIDISKYQGDVDFNQVKQSGVEFVIIRVGYRGTETGVIKEDPYFEKNIKGALAAGLKVGVYFFSVAITEEEALEEAAWTISKVSNYHLAYPIAFDFETFKDRAKGLTNEERTNNALTFLSYIEQKGYKSMLYTYINAYSSRFDANQFFGYKTWIAHYIHKKNTTTSYAGKFYMWQYASDGHVPGIKGRVDMNIAYSPA